MDAARKMDAEDRRASIIAAAMPLFAARGLEGVKTREIAEAAGVSEALLYRHFPSKEELFASVKTTCLDDNAEDVERLNRLPDNTSTFVLATAMVLRRVSGLPGPITQAQCTVKQLLLRSLLNGGEFARGFVTLVAAPWTEKITRSWQGALEAGDLLPGAPRPDLSIWLAHHVAFGLAAFNLVSPPVLPMPVQGEALLDEVTRFALRGIGLRPEAIEAHFNPEVIRLLLAGGGNRA